MSSSVHAPLCRYIYIGAPEQEDPTLMHTTQVNRCVENLTGDTSWRGLVIAFAKNPENEPVDMKASALNKIFDGLGDVLGVRINYDRLVTLRNAPRFETVAI